VEINSGRSSEVKYLFGEKVGDKEPAGTNLVKKEQSIQQRFIRLYNRQGHYSAAQSVETIFGRVLCQLARIAQCLFCCQCAGLCRIREGVDAKRFLMNLTKLTALLLFASTCAFAVLTVNEQLAMSSANGGQGVILMRGSHFPAIPR